MSVAFNVGSIVASAGQQIAFSSLLSVSSTGSPKYILVSGLDRKEYTAASNGNQGSVTGNGHTLGYAASTGNSAGSDSTSFGILFTYNATTGQYMNSTYGNLTSLVLTASTDKTRNAAISLYGSDRSATLQANQTDPLGLQINAAGAYLGTVSVVTQPSYGPAPVQATPNSIAAVAQTFVGQVWNNNGCWVLASNISAEAGASLPVVSSVSGIDGQNNGEWTVAFNGAAGATGDWKSMVRAGDMVVITTAGGTGHITTVVSGSGSSAQVIDNAEFADSTGTVSNSAHDGSASDIIIAKPHLASSEFRGVSASSVVIYRLDTPVITAASSIGLTAGQSVALSSIISAVDPANKPIASYQIFDTTAQDTISVGGTVMTASAASPLTVSAGALGSTVLRAGSAVSGVISGSLMVRAFNGSYWGDWTQVTVGVTPSAVSMTAAGVAANLAPLSAAAAAGTLATVSLTDGGKPVLNLTAAQYIAAKPLIDRIVGSFTVSVLGDGAATTLIGSKGSNRFNAGSNGGNHLLAAGASTDGQDSMFGGSGADTLTGSTSQYGAAQLVAGSGNNVLYGGLGSDTLYGGGRSTLVGGAAYQILAGGYTAASHDTLFAASAGHDFLAVSNGYNTLSAGAGIGNILEGGAGGDKLYGSSAAGGTAILVGGSGANSLNGGLGADTLVGGGASYLVAGASAATQVLLGGYSAAAHDTLSAGSNNALMAVMTGNNVLLGGTGHATLFGGAGNDTLYGAGYGQAASTGQTTFSVGVGNDTVYGGGGNDAVFVREGHGSVVFDGGAGTNSITFAGVSEASAHLWTSASGITTITFDNSARVATLAHVQNVGFAGSGTVHQLAA